MTYVRQGLPPILTIHGDADPTVPYTHATALQQGLQKAGVAAELITIPNGRHGNFPLPDQIKAIEGVRTFLTKHGILRPRTTTSGGADE